MAGGSRGGNLNKILLKKTLAPNIKLFEIDAPLIAAKAQPGQFVVLRVHEEGERIPLTIADARPKDGVVVIVFQEVGKSTFHLGSLNAGDQIKDLIGHRVDDYHRRRHLRQEGLCYGRAQAPD
jgi:NAD(P)H-flavin reductase